ncbi:MAG: S-layer homology domain-containing protein [Synechococcus sp.]
MLRRRPLLEPWHFMLLVLLILLASCQGTPLGESIEQAVAPSTPQPIAPQESPLPQERSLVEDIPSPAPSPAEGVFPTPSSSPPPFPSEGEGPPSSPSSSTRSSPVVEYQTRFSDIGNIPAAASIAALDDLGVFADISGENFQPNRSVRRQEFARWATLANNALYAEVPDRQLPLATANEIPSFLDVPEDDPFFPYIQALVNAEVIQVSGEREFDPEILLSRADLIAIKVALDLGSTSVSGSRIAVDRDWAFVDTAEIPVEAVPAIAADFTLGENSNIRRTFGAIDTFGSKSPVTRAQAAVLLSSFGTGEYLRTPLLAQDSDPGLTDATTSDEADRGDDFQDSEFATPEPNTQPLEDPADSVDPGGSPGSVDNPEPEDILAPNGDSSQEGIPDNEGAETEDNSSGGGKFLDLS